MAVGVEGACDRGAAQQLSNELGVNVLLEQERRARVPEIVEGYVWQICPLKERREGSLPEVRGFDEGYVVRDRLVSAATPSPRVAETV